MGFATGYGACYRCTRIFSFNPLLVPSLTIKGVKEPFCLDCINAANPIRVAKGLAPIVPLPGAYEPCDESELPA